MATKKSNIRQSIEARQQLMALKVPEFLDALETIGIMSQACDIIGTDMRTVAQWMVNDPSLRDRIAVAQEIGKTRRKDHLEAIAYAMAPTNPTMVMFLLKREDPSYRESYNVSTSSQPTNYVIDLGLPDDTAQIADVTPTNVLE